MKVTATELAMYQDYMQKEKDLTEVIRTGTYTPNPIDLSNIRQRVDFMQMIRRKYDLDWYGSYRIAEDGTIMVERGKGLWYEWGSQS